MFEHRFRHMLSEAPAVAESTFAGFTAFPSAVMQNWSSAQHDWVGQMYRIAYERTQAELHTPPRYLRLLTVSNN